MLLAVAHRIAVALIIIERTVGVVCRQGASGLVGVVHGRHLAGQVVFLLHITIHADVGPEVFGQIGHHIHRERVAVYVLRFDDVILA